MIDEPNHDMADVDTAHRIGRETVDGHEPDGAPPHPPTPDAGLRDLDELCHLLESFSRHSNGLRRAVCVSATGALLAAFPDHEPDESAQLAAVVATLRGVTGAAARDLGSAGAHGFIVDFAEGYLVGTCLAEGATLGVSTASDADLGLVGYATTLFAHRTAALLAAAQQELLGYH